MISSRRTFCKRLGGAAIACLTGWSLSEATWLQLEKRDVYLSALPAAFEGMTVALIADTHCGPCTSPQFIHRAIDLVMAESPDLILLLGDYNHHDSKYIEPGIRPFAALHARYGVFGVLGNHDHWEGAAKTVAALEQSQVTVLINRVALIANEGQQLAICGIDDWWAGRPQLQALAHAVPLGVSAILMSHNPDCGEELTQAMPFSLMVSGHTHGGQVVLPFIGAPLLPVSTGQKYRAGLASGPSCPVYVSRGVGTIFPPLRFQCPPEVSLLTLRSHRPRG